MSPPDGKTAIVLDKAGIRLFRLVIAAAERVHHGVPPVARVLPRVSEEYDEAVADIQEGLDDEAAGRVRSLRKFDAEFRRTMGFPT